MNQILATATTFVEHSSTTFAQRMVTEKLRFVTSHLFLLTHSNEQNYSQSFHQNLHLEE